MEWVKVAETEDFNQTNMIQIEVDEEPVALIKLKDDFYALHDICSHAEAYLTDGDIDEDTVLCPLHGAKFDIRTGENLSLPAVTPVDKYEVKVDGINILIAIPEY